MVPHRDRGGVPMEARLTEQWFVDNKTLGQPGLESVREGRTRFVPRSGRTPILTGWRTALVDLAPALVGSPDTDMVWTGRPSLCRKNRRGAAGGDPALLGLEGPWKAWVEDKLKNFQPGEILTRDEDVLDTSSLKVGPRPAGGRPHCLRRPVGRLRRWPFVAGDSNGHLRRIASQELLIALSCIGCATCCLFAGPHLIGGCRGDCARDRWRRLGCDLDRNRRVCSWQAPGGSLVVPYRSTTL